MALLVFYVALALGVSFLCSIMEAVLLSVTPSFAAQAAYEGSAVGIRLKVLKDDVDRPLAAILSLNTIAHTVGAAGAGAQAAVVFGNAYLGVASGVLTLLILVISEIIPKTLGAMYWRPLTGPVVRLLTPTIWIMWPLVKLAQALTRLMTRGRETLTVRRDELRMLAIIGAEEGVLQADESRMMRSLLRFGALTARDVMTPRTVLVSVGAGQTVREIAASDDVLRFSRLPVIGEGIDDVHGVVFKSDVLLAAARDEHDRLMESLGRPLPAVPGETRLRDLLERFLRDRLHIVLVIDEFGGTAGLVTLEDVVETLLGLEIMDEADAVEDMQALARAKWAERAEAMGLRP